MNNEKNYLFKTAELVSDKKAENQLGTMFANSKAGKKVYISKVDAKNPEREIKFVKTNVCNYCHEVFEFYASKASDRAVEFYTNSADYYAYALEQNIPSQEIYAASKEISEVSKGLSTSYVNTKEEDLELSFNK